MQFNSVYFIEWLWKAKQIMSPLQLSEKLCTESKTWNLPCHLYCSVYSSPATPVFLSYHELAWFCREWKNLQKLMKSKWSLLDDLTVKKVQCTLQSSCFLWGSTGQGSTEQKKKNRKSQCKTNLKPTSAYSADFLKANVVQFRSFRTSQRQFYSLCSNKECQKSLFVISKILFQLSVNLCLVKESIYYKIQTVD